MVYKECIFCKKKQKSFSFEDLIPVVLMGFGLQKVAVTDGVCEDCNKYFGRTIDAAFLNNDLVKLLRLRYRRFLMTKNLPKLRKESIKKLIDSEGNIYWLDGVIDSSGSRYEPSSKPNKQSDCEPTIFIRNYEEALQLEETLNKRGKFRVEIEPLIPKQALYGQIEIPIDRKLPSLDILYKMFIEFVHLEFGRQRALDSTFDQLRKALLYPNTNPGYKYKFKMIINLPLDKLIQEKTDITGVSHIIGIFPTSSFWCFFFNMFGEVSFFCSLPNTSWYETRVRTIVFNSKT